MFLIPARLTLFDATQNFLLTVLSNLTTLMTAAILNECAYRFAQHSCLQMALCIVNVIAGEQKERYSVSHGGKK